MSVPIEVPPTTDFIFNGNQGRVERLASPVNQVPETREGWVGTIQEAIQGARRVIESPDLRPSPPVILSPQAWADIVGPGHNPCAEIPLGQHTQPFELPPWVQAGVWVRGKGDPELVACIVSIADDLQVTIRNWRRTPEQISLPASTLARHWEECPRPKEPTHRMDRVLSDDFLEDLAPTKTATVSIFGPSVLVRWAQKIKKFALGESAIMVNPPEVEWSEGSQTRFERLNRDE